MSTTLRLGLLIGLLCGPGLSPGCEAHGAAAAGASKFQDLKADYLKKQADGYDLGEVDALVKKFRDARASDDRPAMKRLLLEIEQALSRAVLPGRPATPSTPEPVAAETPTKRDRFGFGLEFARPGLASKFSETGATWIRIGPIYWGLVEPEPPRNGRHTYRWSRLDKLLREYQSAGFVNAQFITHARSSWASRPAPPPRRAPAAPGGTTPSPSTPPKDAHWEDYAHFISSLVERYDGDGREDMSGLKAPVRHFEIQSEAHHRGYWVGTVEQYGRLLATAYQAAKRASPDSRIILSGLTLSDVFDDSPSPQVLEKRLRQLPPVHRRSMQFMQTALTFKDSFDLVEFHYLQDYKSVYGTVGWIRGQMRSNGYEKPIWAGDAVAAPALQGVLNLRYSKTRSDEIFAALQDPRNPRHAETVAWYEREQAAGLVKKMIVGMEVGLAGVCMGNLRDWPHYWAGKNFRFQGLTRSDSSRRPAFYAYQLLVRKLGSVGQIRRLPSVANVFAYRLVNDDAVVYVMWCDRDKDRFRLTSEAPRLAVTSTFVDQPLAALRPQVRETDQGTVELPLTPVPIIVEHQRTAQP